MNKLKTHLPIILILLLFILLTCNLDTKTEYLELPNYIGDEKEIIDSNNYITSPMKDSIVKDKYSPDYFVDNEIIIYLKSGYNQHLFDNFLNIHELEIVGSLSEINLYQVRTKEHLTYRQLEHKIKEVSKSGIVEFAGPNLITEIDNNYTPNDSDLKDYWYTDIKNESKRTLYLEQIQADKAWDYKDQMETINVGIMDTIFCKHDDLKLNGTATIVEGESDKFYHGTSVAGAVGAKFNNGKGTCGVAPNVKLYAVENEHKNFDGYSSALKQIASLIELVHGYNCKVINASYGNDQRCIAIADGNKNKLKSLQLESSEIELAIKNLLDNHDFVICTSAGNLGIINAEECVKHVLKLKETENKTIDDLYEQVYTDKDIIIAADV